MTMVVLLLELLLLATSTTGYKMVFTRFCCVTVAEVSFTSGILLKEKGINPGSNKVLVSLSMLSLVVALVMLSLGSAVFADDAETSSLSEISDIG